LRATSAGDPPGRRSQASNIFRPMRCCVAGSRAPNREFVPALRVVAHGEADRLVQAARIQLERMLQPIAAAAAGRM
jgi:hypothetical protein